MIIIALDKLHNI